VQGLVPVIERTRARLSRLGELDPVSHDVLVAILGQLEQQLWTSRAQIPARN
jgi:hypothetical protein